MERSSNISLNEYRTSLGVIASPVEISIFKGVTTPSNVVLMLTRIPGYSASSIISEILFSWNLTPSSIGTVTIDEIRFSISSTLTLAPFIVASKSIVERASNPTIAATNIPPFKINLSRYSEREIRSKKRSIM